MIGNVTEMTNGIHRRTIVSLLVEATNPCLIMTIC